MLLAEGREDGLPEVGGDGLLVLVVELLAEVVGGALGAPRREGRRRWREKRGKEWMRGGRKMLESHGQGTKQRERRE